MVTRALYRGPAHVCVAEDDDFRRQVGDFVGLPVRERFPQMVTSGVFEAMDAVYLSGQPIEMPLTSVGDGAVGILLIRPWRVAGEVAGVSCHHYPYSELSPQPPTARRQRAAPVSAWILTGAR